MKVRLALLAIATLSCSSIALARPKDSCVNPHYSNRELRDCYRREQQRANAQADTLAREITSKLVQLAQDASNGPVVNGAFQDAASKLVESQKSWKIYRDEHCEAVGSSWTTGSGAGTAYEECMFNLARQRIQALRHDFDGYTPQTSAKAAK